MKTSLITLAVLSALAAAPIDQVVLNCPSAFVRPVYDTKTGDFDPTANCLASQDCLVPEVSTTTPKIPAFTKTLATPTGSQIAVAVCTDGAKKVQVQMTLAEYANQEQKNAAPLQKTVDRSLIDVISN